MNDQNIYGDHNVSNQYNGDVSLTSLDIVELAREHELARKVVASERRRRTGGSLVLAIIAVAGIVVGYVFFVNCGDLTIADIFNNFASSISIPLVGLVVSGVVSLFSAVASWGKFSHATRAERAKMRAEKALEEAKDQHSVDMERRAKIALQRAINRINVGNRL